MSTESRNQIVSLFVVKPVLENPTNSERSFLSQSTMLAGFVALTLAMGGGVWLIWKVLDNGLMNNLEMALVAMIPIGLAYLAGWIFSILSIRAYNNLVLPFDNPLLLLVHFDRSAGALYQSNPEAVYPGISFS